MAGFDLATYLGIPEWALVLIVFWSIIWMGIAMWKAARRNHLIWFILFLIVHTVGILEILYIFVFSKMGRRQEGKATKTAPAKVNIKTIKKKK